MSKTILVISIQLALYFYNGVHFFYFYEEADYFIFENFVYILCNFVCLLFPLVFLIYHKKKRFELVTFLMIMFFLINLTSGFTYFYLELFRYGKLYEIAIVSVLIKLIIFVISIYLYNSKYCPRKINR